MLKILILHPNFPENGSFQRKFGFFGRKFTDKKIIFGQFSMRCQSILSSEVLVSCVGLALSFHDAHTLSGYFSL